MKAQSEMVAAVEEVVIEGLARQLEEAVLQKEVVEVVQLVQD